jgi:S-adenosyl methyltransferase
MADENRSLANQIDTGRPSVARMYDYYLGGKDNYVVDRTAADQMMSAVPESKEMVVANRAFLARAVHYLAAEVGIRQFLDIGSGLPTRQNVHEVAQAVDPDSRVVYVDHDPHAVVHGKALLATGTNTVFTHGDLLKPEEILEDPKVRALIDFDRPVASLIVAILHFVSDEDDPAGITRRLHAAMAPGGYLAVSHILDDPRTHAIGEILMASGAPQWYPRSRSEITGFFDEFELVDPGVTVLPQWRPPTQAAVPLHSPPTSTQELRWQVAGIARRD